MNELATKVVNKTVGRSKIETLELSYPLRLFC